MTGKGKLFKTLFNIPKETWENKFTKFWQDTLKQGKKWNHPPVKILSSLWFLRKRRGECGHTPLSIPSVGLERKSFISSWKSGNWTTAGSYFRMSAGHNFNLRLVCQTTLWCWETGIMSLSAASIRHNCYDWLMHVWTFGKINFCLRNKTVPCHSVKTVMQVSSKKKNSC